MSTRALQSMLVLYADSGPLPQRDFVLTGPRCSLKSQWGAIPEFPSLYPERASVVDCESRVLERRVVTAQPSARNSSTILFANACAKDTLPNRQLCLSGMVSRRFMASMGESIRLLRTLSFGGEDERQCTGADVLRALGRVSSHFLTLLRLHLSLILALVREECTGLKLINLPTAVLRAVALRAKEVFGAALPREMYASITGACDGKRCAPPLLQLSESPGAQLEIDPEFEPQAADEDLKGVSSIVLMVARLESTWVIALVPNAMFGEGKVRPRARQAHEDAHALCYSQGRHRPVSCAASRRDRPQQGRRARQHAAADGMPGGKHRAGRDAQGRRGRRQQGRRAI